MTTCKFANLDQLDNAIGVISNHNVTDVIDIEASPTFLPQGMQTFDDGIADETGAGGGGETGVGRSVLDHDVGAAPGTLFLGGGNTFTGGVTIEASPLDLTNAANASSGDITFAPDAAGTLARLCGFDAAPVRFAKGRRVIRRPVASRSRPRPLTRYA